MFSSSSFNRSCVNSRTFDKPDVHVFCPYRGLDAAAGMEDSELPNLGVDQGLGLDNTGQKLPDFANRPPGS